MRKETWIFLLILSLLLLIVLTGTVYAVVNNTRARKVALEQLPAVASGQQLYHGLGRLRTRLSDGSTLVLLSIVFPYAADDKAWRDELAEKRSLLQKMAVAYVSSLSPDEIGVEFEMKIKAGLRDVFNEHLVLGEIEELYFTEFDILR